MRQAHNKHSNVRGDKRNKKHNGNIGLVDNFEPIESVKKEPAPLRALNQSQYDYIKSIENNIITFGIGPSGTGKSFVAAAMAAQLLKDGEIDKIIIVRPVVEAGEKLGFLPGELSEKYAPYIAPLVEIFNERLGRTYTQYLLKSGGISASPLAYLRGSTFKNSMVILDEAQNTTPVQMKMFLTRIGDNSKIIIDGDIEQKDIPGNSGLADAINKLKHVPNIKIINFDIDDCVRSGIVKNILMAYS
jgi:phosphate starvation-inducible PhoH-like protein